MHKVLHPRHDVDRLYVPRKEGGRGLTTTEDNVDASIQRLNDYIEKCGGRLIIATIKLFRQQETQESKNNSKAKMGRKNVWAFQARNKRDLTRENLEIAKKGEP